MGDGLGERFQRPDLQQREQVGRRAVENAVDAGEPAVGQCDAGRAIPQGPDPHEV